MADHLSNGMARTPIRRHHLIEEAKAELDVAYDEVKRAEQALMELEFEYNERIHAAVSDPARNDAAATRALTEEKESRQDSLSVDTLYELQNAAVQRFAAISAAFTIVLSVDDQAMAVDLIRNILFTREEWRSRKVDVDRALRDFARGLRGYMRQESTEENDEKVRTAWQQIEHLLKALDHGK